MMTSTNPRQHQIMQSVLAKLGYEGSLGEQLTKFRTENGIDAGGDLQARAGDATFDALRNKVLQYTDSSAKSPSLNDGERRLLGLEVGTGSDPRVDKGQSITTGPTTESTRARLEQQLSNHNVAGRVSELSAQPVPVPGKSTSDYVRPGEPGARWVQDRMLDVLGRDNVPAEVKSDFTKTVKYYQEKQGLLLEGQTSADGKAGPQTLGRLKEDLKTLPADRRPNDATTREFLGAGAARTAASPVATKTQAEVAPSGENEAKIAANPGGASGAEGGVASAGALAPVVKKAIEPHSNQTTKTANATDAHGKPMQMKVHGGDEFREVAERASKTAKETGRPQEFKLNGHKVIVNPGESANDAALKIADKTGTNYSPDRAQDPAFRNSLNAKLEKDGIVPRLREGETLNEFKARASGYEANVNKSIREIETAELSAKRDRINADLKKQGLPTMREGESLDALVKRQAGNYGDAIDKVAQKYRLEERSALNQALKEKGLTVQLGEGQSVRSMLERAGADKASAQKVVGELMNQGKLSALEAQGAIRPAPSTAAQVLSAAEASTTAKVAKSTLGVISKVAVPVGAAMSAYELHSAYEKDQARADGKSTELKKAVGREGGGWAGAAGGAALGAAAGSAVLPVVGTVVGTITGGVIGYFGGSAVGESMMTEREGPSVNIADIPAA